LEKRLSLSTPINYMETKNLFITGGNGEIGKAIITTFQNEGFNIIAPTSRDLDCSSNDSLKDYFTDFSIDISAFVHCAGINDPKSFIDVKPESLLRTLQINTLSFIYISQYLNNCFIDNISRVIAISSIYGSISRSGRLEYATAKHGLKGVVQTLALELAERNILVNSVSPGFIETKLTYKNNSQTVIDKLISDVPLKKLGKAEYIADLVYFLCSQKNQFITGQDMIIDGGYLSGGFQPK